MKDLKGQKFNRLTVIKPVGKTTQRSTIWECRCDCGKIKNIVCHKLTRGSTKSCGCLKAENLKLEGNAHPQWAGYEEISKTFYNRMVFAATKRRWEWKLTIEYLWELFMKQQKKCAITGIPLFMPIHLRQLTKKNQITASLDRIDSNKGYLEGNVQWVCKRINYMKHTQSNEIFLEFVKAIYEYNQLDKKKPNLEILTSAINHTFEPENRIKIKRISKMMKSVIQFDLNGNVLNEYFSAKEAADRTGVGVWGIYHCCSGRIDEFKNYRWKYKEMFKE